MSSMDCMCVGHNDQVHRLISVSMNFTLVGECEISGLVAQNPVDSIVNVNTSFVVAFLFLSTFYFVEFIEDLQESDFPSQFIIAKIISKMLMKNNL